MRFTAAYKAALKAALRSESIQLQQPALLSTWAKHPMNSNEIALFDF